MATVQIDQAALDRMLKGRQGAVGNILAGFAGHANRQVKQIANQRVQRRTGQYLAGIHSTIRQGTQGPELRVWGDAPHTIYIESGTRPHFIFPRRARVLAFQTDGQTVFTRRVKHPGTPAFNILRDGTTAAASRFF